ncbi:LysR family transcriptional regulator [Paraburkholderia sp. JHI869]|uniref:LysR family transcriptional regulator n=1 Tax=Paraburkholderia sp. JHI869 TaxID=3112959 RepID=UPI0031797E53
MNFSQLHFASAVASLGSFTAAASACAVTQPTLSNGIAQLEEELGQRLFVRTTRKVILTAFGKSIIPDIDRILNAQRALIQNSQALLKPNKQVIRIGISPLLDGQLLKVLIEPFHRRMPHVELILREMNMADLDKMMDEGELDFVFGVEEIHKESRRHTLLYREQLLYLPRSRQDDNLSKEDEISFSEIADETFVMVPDACGLTRTIRSLFRAHRRVLNEYPGEAMSYQVLEQWSALGIGAAMLPLSKLSSKGRLALQIRDKAGDIVMIGFEAVWDRDSMKIEHLAKFAEYLRDVVPAMTDGFAENINNQNRS